MRKRLTWILALGAVMAVAVAGIAASKPTELVLGNIVLNADGGVTPKALSKTKMQPVTVEVKGDVSTKDGTHPPALRETIIDFDKNGAINAKGIKVCKEGQLIARSTTAAKKACPQSIVGEGHTKVEVEFAESKPFTAEGPLVLFNGGVKGKTTTMYIHAYVAVPAPTGLVVPVQVTKIHKGRYGVHTVAKLPVVAGGAGSTLHFDLKVNPKRTNYVTAKCTDGKFFAKIEKAEFKDEKNGGVGNATLSGEVIRPCRAKR